MDDEMIDMIIKNANYLNSNITFQINPKWIDSDEWNFIVNGISPDSKKGLYEKAKLDEARYPGIGYTPFTINLDRDYFNIGNRT